MKYENLAISNDEKRLIDNLLLFAYDKDPLNKACFDNLRQELVSAKLYEMHELPKDVVRIHSKFDVDTPYGIMKGYQLVLPKDKNAKEKKISILSPMGSAVIGYAQGDEVMWDFPSGKKKIKILKVENEFY